MDFKVGLRLHSTHRGYGKVFAIDKHYRVTYIRWDVPYTKHGAREEALHTWMAESLERVSGGS